MSTAYYTALAARDRTFDGVFVYGVRTTGVYCRPSCSSRRPRPENVDYFSDAAKARDAGFRACKRCRPDETETADARIVAACRYIDDVEHAPTLRELSERAGMSESHFQRKFTAALGVSPRAYALAAREERLRGALRGAPSVTGAIYDAGFNSASQAYGNASSAFGMSLSQFRSGGKGVEISYALADSALGKVLVAATSRGVCRVDISSDANGLEMRLRQTFPRATIVRSDEGLETTTSVIVRYLSGDGAWPKLPVDVRASAFQARVWSALREISPGFTMSYAQLATAIGSPSAARAVARACASNPVALLIPCHRIVPSSGGVGGYRWDSERKRRLLDMERGSNSKHS